MNQIYAEVIADHITKDGVRLTTLETCAPKFIDAEFEKHRMLSSNSSSSRAIPFKKLEDVYLPFDIRKNQKGMQGYERLDKDSATLFRTGLSLLESDIFNWLEEWKDLIHKQHLNRYLEPWTLQSKVVTATEWDNFFKLRLAPDAQPEIQELARCMKEAMDSSVPVEFKPGDYHLPYIDHNSWDMIDMQHVMDWSDYVQLAIKCSIARCARVSYNNHDGSSPSIKKDLALYDMLLSSGHMSPFEHVATPMSRLSGEYEMLEEMERGVSHVDRNLTFWSGNFRGWIQYRKLVESYEDGN